jgi:hypothetical protein
VQPQPEPSPAFAFDGDAATGKGQLDHLVEGRGVAGPDVVIEPPPESGRAAAAPAARVRPPASLLAGRPGAVIAVGGVGMLR